MDVAVEQQIETPQISIKPKRELLKQYGLTVNDVAEFANTAFAGEAVSDVLKGKQSYDMVVRFDSTSRGGIDKMKRALIDLPNGTKIALGQVADIKSVSSPNTINRENVQRKVVVSEFWSFHAQ